MFSLFVETRRGEKCPLWVYVAASTLIRRIRRPDDGLRPKG